MQKEGLAWANIVPMVSEPCAAGGTSSGGQFEQEETEIEAG